MLDIEEFDRWRGAADDALAGAHVQAEADLNQWACFLAEQAGQLAVKGLLHGVGAGARGHDLVRLGEHLADALEVRVPEEVAAALRRLSRHYLPPRYPDAHPAGTPGRHYGPDDAKQAIADVETVMAHVAGAWEELTAGG